VVYEWDPQKAQRNLQKHGILFDEAASVFLDPMALTYSDPDHSEDEEREITIGISGKGRPLFVSHCERAGGLRIISVRKATQKEIRQYEQAYEPSER
jgi:uncharacterized DUF497 family protein